MNDDDIPESVKRGVAKALFGTRAKAPIVETRKSKPRPVVEATAKIRPLMDPGDEAVTVTFNAVLPDGKRAHLRTVRLMEPMDCLPIVKEYEDEGRVVQWLSKRPEEFTEKDFDDAWM